MHKVLILGGGKIGRTIASFLIKTGDYQLTIGDVSEVALARIKDDLGADICVVNASDLNSLAASMQGMNIVISALSYHFNPAVAQAALQSGASYFDLTEDVETTRAVRETAAEARPGQIFMPQCGLAPGFISIAAQSLAQRFDSIDRIHMRVGALPQFPTGQLKYNLTWSTDGLINEYCNPCEAIQNGKQVDILPLEGLEQFSLDGVRYEAFNTSGGLGTLCETWAGKVRELNYKTIRYQGHQQLMQLLVNELRLSDDRETMKRILENAVPITFQDVVVTFCSVTGQRRGELVQITDARKMYATDIDGVTWSAIQLTTASGVCAVIDLFAQGSLPQQGFVRQEQVELGTFLKNRFGKNYESSVSTKFSQSSRKTKESTEDV